MELLNLILLAASLGAATCQTITTPPGDFTAIETENAIFTCIISNLGTGVMMWTRVEPPEDIYIYRDGAGNLLGDPSKYNVTADGSTFHLEIMNTQLTDGGRYQCKILTGGASTANLVVLEEPIITLPVSPLEGSTGLITCDARFGGPRWDQIGEFQRPKIATFLEGFPFPDEGVTETATDAIPGSTWFTIEQVHNLTLDYSMNGRKVTCELKTETPGAFIVVTAIFVVNFEVRNIDYTPQQEEYEVGSYINCTAEGNPSPSFKWTATDSNDPAEISQAHLPITSTMMGSNTWRCDATNTVDGIPKTVSIIASFTVIPASPTDPPYDEVKSADAWKIAVGVCVPLLIIIIGCAAALVYFSVVKKKRDKPGSSSKTVNSQDSGFDEKANRNRAYNDDSYEDTNFPSQPPYTIHPPATQKAPSINSSNPDLIGNPSLTGNGIGYGFSPYPNMDYPQGPAVYTKPNVKPRKSTSSQDSHNDTSHDMYDTSRDPVPQHVSFDDQAHQDLDDQPSYANDPYSDPHYYRPAPLPPDSQV